MGKEEGPPENTRGRGGAEREAEEKLQAEECERDSYRELYYSQAESGDLTSF